MKRYSVRTLIVVLTVVAVAVALGVPHLWRLNPTSDVHTCIRFGHEAYPRVNAICFYNPRARVIVLHKVTSEIYIPKPTDGGYSPVGYPLPWLELTPDFNNLFDCKINGRRVFIDDSVQFYYAVDDQAPKFVRIAYSDFASTDNVAMLQTNEEMWGLSTRAAVSSSAKN